MSHDAYGWWIEDAWGVHPRASTRSVLGHEAFDPLESDADADVVIVGGGFSGMWAALRLAQSVPASRIVLLEAEVCGTGPSGRNGGFCDSFVEAAPRLIDQFGLRAARALVEKSISNISRIGEIEDEIGEFGFKQAGQLIAVTGEGQEVHDKKIVDAVMELELPVGTAKSVDQEEARALCDSSRFSHGLYLRDTATLHPGKLAANLRFALFYLGVEVYEMSPVTEIRSVGAGVEVVLRNGCRVRAQSGILAAGVASAGFGGMEREVTMTSSHIVVTEPIPEILSRIGWKNGLAVTDARYLVHYFRTTGDSRILFGWGGGRIARGVQPERRESIDWGVVSQTITDLKQMFPILENVRIDRAWGGPIDASPVHMPMLRQFSDGWVAAFGYTGNGVGPSRMLGEAMADIAIGEFGPGDPVAPLLVDQPVRLPPEPFSALGGALIRRGLDKAERRGEAGRRVPLWAKQAAGIPARLGYRIGR